MRGNRMSADELQERRKSLGLSVADLAREFMVLPTTIYRWEDGEGPPRGLTSIGADTVLKRLETEQKRGDR
jgi:transcriptional regulator with XRE-family HTH domain